MTIKQYGGVFGRNPTFNNVTVDGTLTVDQIVEKTGAAGITLDGVTLKDGNVVLANGKGIDFSATSGTGTSELFDDYEEGEHTAVITATTSGTITLDSTNNKLAYTKVGRVVHVQGTIVVDSVSLPVGVAKITLPFTASNSLSGLAERSPPSIWIQGSVSKNTTDFIGYIAEGSNQISVGTGDSTNFLSLGANQLQASSSIYISVTYTAS